jgi:hypothetical protein
MIEIEYCYGNRAGEKRRNIDRCQSLSRLRCEAPIESASEPPGHLYVQVTYQLPGIDQSGPNGRLAEPHRLRATRRNFLCREAWIPPNRMAKANSQPRPSQR